MGKKGKIPDIARRDFLQGAALCIGAGLAPATAQDLAPQDRRGYYPPLLTGMRGSHPGSFEVAHQVRDGNFWRNAKGLREDNTDYDLVIVGGGISGLSAAAAGRLGVTSIPTTTASHWPGLDALPHSPRGTPSRC